MAAAGFDKGLRRAGACQLLRNRLASPTACDQLQPCRGEARAFRHGGEIGDRVFALPFQPNSNAYQTGRVAIYYVWQTPLPLVAHRRTHSLTHTEDENRCVYG